MHWLFGLDEAGYGPNLGPLVIGATAWRVNSDNEVDLYAQLSKAITGSIDKSGRLTVADSKQIYKPHGSLRELERSVYSCLIDLPSSWSNLLAQLQADPNVSRQALPWHEVFDIDLPVDANQVLIQNAQSLLQQALVNSNVDQPLLMARIIFPEEFNLLVERYETKGAALSDTTIRLLRSLIEQTGLLDRSEVFHATLDKHGGRNRYAGLLQEFFPEHLVQPIIESRAESRYQWGECTFCFRSKGESQMQVALASMIAKLLREIAMKAFNQFWVEKVPGIKPTAGYPVDAKRFKAEILSVQQELGITESIIWRSR